MRLRHLYIGNYHNLQNIDIHFPASQNQETDITQLPVHLLLGVNGTGKTGILRAIAHIFAYLELRRAPTIPFEISYELNRGDQHYLVTIECDGRGPLGGVNFLVRPDDDETQTLEPAEWENYLPSLVVAYTSGITAEWELLTSDVSDRGMRLQQEQSALLRRQQEDARDLQEISGPGDLLDYRDSSELMTEVVRMRTRLYTNEHLELALLAALAIQHGESSPEADAQTREVFTRADIDGLQGFALRLQPLANHDATGTIAIEQANLLLASLFKDRLEEEPEILERLEELSEQPTPVLPPQRNDHIRKLAELADHCHRNPNGSYHLFIRMTEDVQLRIGGSQGLFSNPEQFFEFLVDLRQRGVLMQVDMILRKRNVEQSFLSRHLSDGEFAFLGRMALLLLLRQSESLFLLDEPETHFNDVWKREVVDILTTVLTNRESMVLLSTHSSIVISDVAHPQLILLVKDTEGKTNVIDDLPLTFGGDPSDIMVNILGAPRAGGTLSAERLSEALERGKREELEALLAVVSPGYWRFRIRDRLESLNATSH